MLDIDHLINLGVFNQLIPVWHVFFFIAGMLPFMLFNRIKICLLITYLFTFYLGFMVQWGDYIAANGAMQPFVLYSFSGLAIAVFFVSTIFSETVEPPKGHWMTYQKARRQSAPEPSHDPLEEAITVTPSSVDGDITGELR